MNRIFFLLALSLFTARVHGQAGKHKIVFDLADGDTATHSTVLRQFNNVLRADPTAELELVCHGQAVNMFLKNKIYFEEKIKELNSNNKVSYKVCANSLRRLGIDQTQISPLADIVPVAILELSTRQEEGWTYIKAGH